MDNIITCERSHGDHSAGAAQWWQNHSAGAAQWRQNRPALADKEHVDRSAAEDGGKTAMREKLDCDYGGTGKIRRWRTPLQDGKRIDGQKQNDNRRKPFLDSLEPFSFAALVASEEYERQCAEEIDNRPRDNAYAQIVQTAAAHLAALLAVQSLKSRHTWSVRTEINSAAMTNSMPVPGIDSFDPAKAPVRLPANQ